MSHLNTPNKSIAILSPDTKMPDQLKSKRKEFLDIQREIATGRKTVQDLTRNVEQARSNLCQKSSKLAEEMAAMSLKYSKHEGLLEETRIQTEAEAKLCEEGRSARERQLINDNKRLTEELEKTSEDLKRIVQQKGEENVCLAAELYQTKQKHDQAKEIDELKDREISRLNAKVEEMRY